MAFGLAFGGNAVQGPELPALGLADCLCDPTDILASIQVLDSSLTVQEVIPLEVWIGSGCDDPAHRAPGGGCKLVAPSLTSLNFSQGGSISFQPISVRDLIDPAGTAADPCAAGSYTNELFIIFNPARSPTEFCHYTIPVDTVLTGPPTNVAASAGTDAAEVTWDKPDDSSHRPVAYQVLCAAADGAPISAHDFSNMAGYGACNASGKVERSSMLTGGVADGMGPPPPGGGTVGVPPFTNLRHAFLCSGPLDPMKIEATIGELPAGHPISFAVVAIDEFGNANASSVVTAAPLSSTPPPMMSAGCHCAIGGRGARSAPFIVVVLMIVLALRRRAG